MSRDCWTDFLRLAPRAGRGARGGAIWSATEGQKGRRQHDINVEDVVDAEDGETYPVCVVGARACPPEDCGGIWVYEQFLAALVDPNHDEHDTMLEWVGGEFDPERFDLVAVNRALAPARRRRTPSPA